MRDFGFYEKFGYKLGLHDVTTKKNSEMQTFVKLEDFKKKKNYKQCVSSTLQYQREALVKTTVSSQKLHSPPRKGSFPPEVPSGTAGYFYLLLNFLPEYMFCILFASLLLLSGMCVRFILVLRFATVCFFSLYCRVSFYEATFIYPFHS